MISDQKHKNGDGCSDGYGNGNGDENGNQVLKRGCFGDGKYQLLEAFVHHQPKVIDIEAANARAMIFYSYYQLIWYLHPLAEEMAEENEAREIQMPSRGLPRLQPAKLCGGCRGPVHHKLY